MYGHPQRHLSHCTTRECQDLGMWVFPCYKRKAKKKKWGRVRRGWELALEKSFTQMMKPCTFSLTPRLIPSVFSLGIFSQLATPIVMEYGVSAYSGAPMGASGGFLWRGMLERRAFLLVHREGGKWSKCEGEDVNFRPPKVETPKLVGKTRQKFQKQWLECKIWDNV